MPVSLTHTLLTIHSYHVTYTQQPLPNMQLPCSPCVGWADLSQPFSTLLTFPPKTGLQFVTWQTAQLSLFLSSVSAMSGWPFLTNYAIV